MIHKTGYTEERHRPDTIKANVGIVKEVGAIGDSLYARHGNILREELAIEGRKIIELLSEVIGIKRLSKGRAELTSNLADAITIFRKTLLIAKGLLIDRQTTRIKGLRSLRKYFLVLDELFAKMSEYRIVVIESRPTIEHTGNTLLIRKIGTDRNETDDIAMLNERLDKANAGL